MIVIREKLKDLCGLLDLFSRIRRSPKVRWLQDRVIQWPDDVIKSSASLYLPTSANKLCPQDCKVVVVVGAILP